jgi:hypothetical protein
MVESVEVAAAYTLPLASTARPPEEREVIARLVVVAFVVVAPPVITRLPFTVDDAEEINPLWKRCRSEVVAPPEMVRPVPSPPPPIVEEAETRSVEVAVSAPPKNAVPDW